MHHFCYVVCRGNQFIPLIELIRELRDCVLKIVVVRFFDLFNPNEARYIEDETESKKAQKAKERENSALCGTTTTTVTTTIPLVSLLHYN